MSTQPGHWQAVYETREEQRTSWFRAHLDESLRLLEGLALPLDTPIIDIGGGRSTFVDDLLSRGFRDLTVLDLSGAALAQARLRVQGNAGEIGGAVAENPAGAVRWIEGDVLETDLPGGHFGLWHDRAVFHFLASAEDQARYARLAHRSLREGGHLIIATFAEDGPAQCSGLPVCRYSPESLAACFSPGFEPVASSREVHRTPFDTEQPFTYLVLRRLPDWIQPHAHD